MPEPIDPVAFHDFEHAGWQKASTFYADTFGTLTAQTIDPLLDSVRAKSGMRVLDVASGPGYAAGAAAARGATVVGIDFSPLMVEEARRRYESVASLEFLEGDAERLPFKSNQFGAVVMNFGLLHLARPEVAISEAFRVLEPGGRYAFTVWGKPDEAVGFGVVLRAMETHGRTDVGLPDGPPFFRFSDAGECHRTLAQAGFREINVRQLPLVWNLPSADALFQAALCGGVRTSAALQAQTPEALAAIRSAVHAALQQYTRDDTVALPMGVILASAAKP
jgi:SAM-dependent methyltransferase